MNGHVIENNDNIVQTQSIMGRASNPPWVAACCKPSFTCGSFDLQTCGATERVESSRFCKPFCPFVDDFIRGSCVLPSFRSDTHLRKPVDSGKFGMNRLKTSICSKTPCAFMTSIPVLGDSYFGFLLIFRYLCQLTLMTQWGCFLYFFFFAYKNENVKITQIKFSIC